MSVAAVGHHGHDQIRLKLELRVREADEHEHVGAPAVAGSDGAASEGVAASTDSGEESDDSGELELSLRARIREDGDLRIRLKLEADFEATAAGQVIDELKLKIDVRFRSHDALGELGEAGNQLAFSALEAFGSLLSGIVDSLGQTDDGGSSVVDSVQAAFAEFSATLQSIFGLGADPALASGDSDPDSAGEGDGGSVALAPPVTPPLPADAESTDDSGGDDTSDHSAPGQALTAALRSFLEELHATAQTSLGELRTLLGEGGIRAGFRVGHGEDHAGVVARYQIRIDGAGSADDAPDGVDLEA